MSKMKNDLSIPQQGIQARAERRANQKLADYKLMIATPCYMSQVFSPYTESLLQAIRMLESVKRDYQTLFLNGDSYIDRAKNSIVAAFLESNCTDLLMIDSDMQWSPEAVARMISNQQEIIGGFFPMKNAWSQFCGHLQPDENGNTPDLSKAVEMFDGSCLFPAHLIPGGFLRFKRAALERFADAYPGLVYQDPCADPGKPDRIYTSFFECVVFDHLRHGEDATFCRRAREMGMELWCDPNITFGHYGIKGFHGNFHETLLKPPEEIARLMEEREALDNAATAVRVAFQDTEEVAA